MKDEENPWRDRAQGLTRDRIRTLARLTPQPLALTELQTPASTERLVGDHFESFYHVSEAILDVLELLCGRALDACLEKYSDVRSYKLQMVGPLKPSDPRKVTCITGLAGSGKTELIEALARVMGKPAPLPLNDFFAKPSQIAPFKDLRLKGATTVKQIFALLCPEVFVGCPPTDMKVLIDCMSRCLYGDGVLYIALDELQFVSMSAGANTRVAQLLLAVRWLGVDLSYNTNFEMGRRLRRRPQEERDRLLQEIICLRPYSSGTTAWTAYLKDVHTALGDISGFDMVAEQEWVHRHTQGLPRSVKRLFARGSYVMAARGESKLLQQHLVTAYHSDALVEFKADNEAIFKQTVSKVPDKRRMDLWCPFGDRFNFGETTASSSQSSTEMAEKITEQSMTAVERAGHKALVAAGQASNSGQSGNVVPLSRARPKNRKSVIESTLAYLRSRSGADVPLDEKKGAD